MAGGGRITMTMRELDRLRVLQGVADGNVKPKRAAERLALTTRQVHRLVKRLRDDGPAGLASRKHGKSGNNQLSPGIENQAVALIRDSYPDFGPTLAREKLAELHGLTLAKETVRRIMVGGLNRSRGRGATLRRRG